MPKTLTLTLHKKAFDVMVTGEKTEEFRSPSEWLNSRLYDHNKNKIHYDYVRFINGYHKLAREFTAEFKGVECCYEKHGYCFSRTYSNGLKVRKIDTRELYIINLGKIINTKNL